MPLRSICRPFETPSRRLGALQAHSSLRTLQQSVPRHPEIGEREQCVQLRRVLHQPAVAHLHKPELALDHTDRKSVVSGKRVSVRVDLGGSRIIKKKKTQKQ